MHQATPANLNEAQRRLTEISLRYIDLEPSELDFQIFCDDLRNISGAACTIINRYDETKDLTRVVAISGLSRSQKSFLNSLGLNLMGREWRLDEFARRTLTSHQLRGRGDLTEHTAMLSARLLKKIKSVFGVGEILTIGLCRRQKSFGTMLLVMQDGKSIEYPEIVEQFAHVLGSTIFRLTGELELRASNERLRQIETFINCTADGLQVADESGKMIFMNRVARDRLGYQNEDIRQHYVWDFEPLFKKRKVWLQHLKELKEIGDLRSESKYYNPNEKLWFPVELSVRFEQIDGKGYVIANSRDLSRRKKIEAQITSQQQELRQLMQALEMSSLLTVTDTDGIIYYANELFCQASGYSAKELIGQPHRIVASGIHPPRFWQNIWKKLRRGNTVRAEICNRHKDGSLYWMDTVFNPILDSQGNIIRYLAIRQDITARKNGEQKLRDLNLLMDNIFKEMDDVIWSVSLPDYEMLFLTPSVESLYGLSRADWMKDSKNWERFIHPEDRRVIGEIYEMLERDGRYEAEYRIIDTRGNLKWISNRGKKIFDKIENKSRIDGYIKDITAIKTKQLELEESSRALREAQKIARIGRWELNLRNNKLLWSDSIFEIFEIDSRKFGARYESFINAIHPEDREMVNQAYQNSLIDKKPYSIEHRLLMPDGRVKWLLETCRTDYDTTGQAIRSVGIVQDITATKEAARELVFTQKMLERTSKVARIGGWEYDLREESVYTTNVVRSLLALPENSTSALQDYLLPFFPDSRQQLQDAIEYAIISGIPFSLELQIKRQQLKNLWVQVIGYTEFFNEKCIKVYGTLQDINDQKKSQLSILQQNKFRSILAEISASFIRTNDAGLDQAIISALEKVGEHFSVDRVFLMQTDHQRQTVTNSHNWYKFPVDNNTYRIESQPLSLTPWFNAQIVKNSYLRINDISMLPDEAENEKNIWKKQNISSLLNWRIDRQNEIWGLIGLASSSPFDDSNINDEYISGLKLVGNLIMEALSRRTLQADLRSAREYAEQASRAKSQFLANMSHEIRTPLNGIIGFSELLLHSQLKGSDKEYIRNINNAAQTLLEILNDILDFSKIEAGKLELEFLRSDLRAIAEQAADLIKFSVSRKNLELLLRITPVLPQWGKADSIRLKQCLINLLSNAVKFTDHGEVELNIDFKPVDDKTGIFTFMVRDTGIGITDEQRKRLFSAFTQADVSITRRYGGTGLGLTITNNLVKQMGGTLSFVSQPGRGTVFSFSLTMEYEYDESATHEFKKPGLKVLVIEKNLRAQEILSEILNYWQVPVEFIADAETFDIEAKYFHSIILSQAPGDLGCYTILDKLRKQPDNRLKNLPLILLVPSGQTTGETDQLPGVFRLEKPVRVSELFATFLQIRDKKSVQTAVLPPKAEVSEVQYNNARGCKILIAEDVEMNMVLLRTAILRLKPDANIIAAENGAKAIQRYFQEKPDLVLMDVQMPLIDGLTAAADIRLFEASSDVRVPIIALSAGISIEERQKCLDSGMDDFLSKPFTLESLRTTLSKYLPPYD